MPFDFDELNQRLLARLPPGLMIPPPCLTTMQGEPLDYVEDQSLSMRFPVLPEYRNPLGYMQGGFIVAALDNTMGPFSYLIAPPSVTNHLSIEYLRPVVPGTAYIDCVARLQQRTARHLYLTADVLSPEGKVVAICQSTCQVLER